MKRRQRFRIDTDAVWRNFSQVIGQMRLAGKVPVVEIVPQSRSLDQNAMVYALYQQIATQVEDQAIVDIRRECKLHFGVPIMRAGNEDFRYVYDNALKPLDYEFKLRAMDWLPVTSKMDKSQCTEFIDTVIREYSQRGLSLTHPSEAQYG